MKLPNEQRSEPASGPKGWHLGGLTSDNPAMARCLKLASLAAKSDVPVLLVGETGTGKTLLARVIHNSSPRSAGPFISFNSSAISDTLLESQLFGHERGAFTGADRALRGKFELADAGTVFLDEIADMSLLAQAKILRVVEYGEFERLGSERMLTTSARIIAASNCSLRERVRQGRFREDLYHRLSGLTLLVPPLRDRGNELPALIASEIQQAARLENKKITSIHPEAMERLLAHPWPGNLRELHHTLRTTALLCEGDTVLPEHILLTTDYDLEEPRREPESEAPRAARPSEPGPGDLSLSAAVNRHIQAVYSQSGRNQRRTARLLGISRATLIRHLNQMREK